MLISLPDVLLVLEQYKYLLLFPLATIESLTTSVVSGFLVHFGVFNIFVVYIVLILADLTGDSFRYVIGRNWRRSVWIKKYGHLFGYNDKSEKFLEDHFVKHKAKTFIFAKLSPGFGTAVQIAAGIARVDYFDYICFSLVTTIPRTLFLLLFGFFAGNSYVKIDGYLHFYTLFIGSIILIIILYFVLNKHIKNYFTKVNNLE